MGTSLALIIGCATIISSFFIKTLLAIVPLFIATSAGREALYQLHNLIFSTV
jgi:hypothetical protein